MATGGNAIRGTRVGSGPMGEQDHGYHADRIAVSYWDAMGPETVRNFGAGDDEAAPGREAEAPAVCVHCGRRRQTCGRRKAVVHGNLHRNEGSEGPRPD